MIKKKSVLIIGLVLLLATYVIASPIIDTKIVEKHLEEKYVEVIVELKETDIQLNNLFNNDTSQIQNLKNYHKESQKNLLKKLNFSDFKLKSQYDFFNGFSGKISQDGLNELKNNDNVVRIIYDEPENLLRKESNKLIELEKIINLKTSLAKLDGQGQTVCVLDSGIDYTHRDLGGCTQSQFLAGNCNKVIGGYDYYSNDANPMDTEGHGTNVAGIIAGDGFQSGVAPKAKLIALRVCDGSCPVSAQMSALDWCINNASKYNISVISMSIGSDKFGDYCDPDGRTEQIKNARDLGISVVIASGNDGYTDGISKPACIPYAISVGSVYDYDGSYSSATCTDNDAQVDKISCFSNRDDILDLVAPGSRITTTDLGNSYDTVSGTSFATPYVSGLIALLKQAYGNVSVIQLKDTLKVTGKIINDSGFSNLNYPRINALAALEIDWPTYHHDNRRTGFTLLKGDLNSLSSKKGMNLVLTGGVTADALARPSIADIDRNERQEVVVSFAKSGSQAEGWISSIEKSKILGRSVEKWTKDIHYPVSAAASIDNLDSETNLEVVVGLKNGTLIVIDPDGSKDPPMKWTYTVPLKYSAQHGGNIRGNLGFTAIDDIDINGKNDIIFTDYQVSLFDWNGTLYVLEDNGATYTEKATINLVATNNGGAQGAVAIANLDSDDNQEIVVPGFYGIKVYDYNSGSLSLKCQNTNGKILGTPVIYDIDRDNQYEIIYTTANYTCLNNNICNNTLYIINASTCTTEKAIALDIFSLVAPAIANLDSDSNLEIVVQGRTTASGNLDKVEAYDYNTASLQWTYPSTGGIAMIDVAPNIADIDGNGNYDIILAKNSSSVLVLKNDGSLLQEFNIDGQIGSSPVIGDLSGKGVAELSIKRAGSPIAVLTTLTGNNSLPVLNAIENITAIAGELINLNATGEISATDPDNDAITFYYSSPFNSTGIWQSNASDEGNYSILVEVSDGNLSDYQYIDLKVFSNSSYRQNTFITNQQTASLIFSQSQNKTVQVRLPKNANVVYSKMKLRGGN